MDTYMNEFDFLREQAVSEDLIKEILEFRKEYTVAADAVGRVQQPAIHFYGKETLEMAMAALLQGENLLLTGPKALVKIYWQRILPIFSADRSTMYLFM